MSFPKEVNDHSSDSAAYPSMYMTPEGKALKQQYQWEAKAQWRGPKL